VPLECFHTKTGPGAFGGAIAADEGLRAADRAALFKTAVKEIASRQGFMATFMAQWSGEPAGSSCHLHQSLWNGDRKQNLFHDAGGMSGLMRSYIAGLLANMPEMMALYCPTVNSYKRTPVHATWGTDNRNAAVRAIAGDGKGTHVELRLTGADINPYIAMAAALAAGLDGIERNLDLEALDADEALPLPRTLSGAVRRLRESERARCWLGEEFIEHYACTREWEVRRFEKAVTDWELARYFEAI
jgi:glutamine synthetase